jgi:hypothetical protein
MLKLVVHIVSLKLQKVRLSGQLRTSLTLPSEKEALVSIKPFSAGLGAMYRPSILHMLSDSVHRRTL